MNTGARLAGRRIVLGVTGSVAAYKAAELARLLVKEGAVVRTVFTAEALKFIAPMTFESLTGQPVYTQLFDQPRAWEMEHITWARWAEAVVIAPATANVLAKLAGGLADDPLTTLCLARETRVPLLVAPAMNTQMWLAPATQRNVERLRADGVTIVEPGSGDLACREVGPGRLAEMESIVGVVAGVLAPTRDLDGCRVLINAGPTREALDAVRVLTNPSTGKMGFALAEAAARRGAQVTLVAGPTELATPPGAHRIDVVTAEQMWHEMRERWVAHDAVIFAAAVCDFRPTEVAKGKVKKSDATRTVGLEPTVDIAGSIGAEARRRPDAERPLLVGFAAESENLEAYARGKLEAKGFDLIVANEIGRPDSGFAAETTRAVILAKDGPAEPLGLVLKGVLAERLLDRVAQALPNNSAPSVRRETEHHAG